VTLQIALIGSDGWVLASDKKARNLLGPSSWLTTKIAYTTEWACSFWGDEVARAVRDQITGALQSGQLLLNDPSFNSRLQQMSNSLWKSKFESLGEHERNSQAQHNLRGVIFMQKDKPCQIIDLSVARESYAEFSETKTVKGDTRNSAAYFIERYYDEELRAGTATVSVLKKLAAHTILTSSHINLQNIEGLQIVSCQGGIIAQLESDGLSQLIEDSKNIDKAIKKIMRVQ
jgi:hypothetical protein